MAVRTANIVDYFPQRNALNDQRVQNPIVAAALLAALSFGADAAPTVQEANPGYQHMAQAVVTSKTVVGNGHRTRVVVKKR